MRSRHPLQHFSIAFQYAIVYKKVMPASDARQKIESSELKELVKFLNARSKKNQLQVATRVNLNALIDSWIAAREASLDRKRFDEFEIDANAPRPVLLKMVFPPGCPSWSEIRDRLVFGAPAAGSGVYSTIHYGEEPKNLLTRAVPILEQAEDADQIELKTIREALRKLEAQLEERRERKRKQRRALLED